MKAVTNWLHDLALGFRLAVGGCRSSSTGIAKLLLGTVGTALTVAVLFGAASVDHVLAERDKREDSWITTTDQRPGVDPLYILASTTNYQGGTIPVHYLNAGGPNAPVPPGMTRLPAPGEVVLSPALAELIDSEAGASLRGRFSNVVAVLDRAVLLDPGGLRAWRGEDASLRQASLVRKVYGFGGKGRAAGLPPILLMFVVLAVIALLIPVLIFASTASRIAGAERDRRLSAIRLVGSDARQVRRIAAAESLLSAIPGLALGAVFFLAGREVLGELRLFGITVLPQDVVPSPVLAVLIAIGVTALSLLTGFAALRGTIIEPLSVVRKGKTVRRRLGWRLVLVLAGVAVFLLAELPERGGLPWMVMIGSGVGLLLIGVPALLPWLVERAAGRIHGGRPSVRLAVGRLTMDSGTPVRVIAGVAVVLTSAVSVFLAITSIQSREEMQAADAPPSGNGTTLSVTNDRVDVAMAAVRTVAGVRVDGLSREFYYKNGQRFGVVTVMDCATIGELLAIPRCHDGDSFLLNPAEAPGPGAVVEVDSGGEPSVTWRVPGRVQTVDVQEELRQRYSLVVTPGAVSGAPLHRIATVHTRLSGEGTVDALRDAVAELGWRATVHDDRPQASRVQQQFGGIRAAVLAGAVFVLLLAGTSLLVLALEQVRERRRSMAAMFATGVPRGVLARSMLWQMAMPLLFGVVVAIATGIGLAYLALRLIPAELVLDWPGIGLLVAATVIMVLLTTLATLPSIKSATRVEALRAE